MFKIKYLPTGHVFILPEHIATELKENSPNEYQIIEKNGKKFKDSIKVTSSNDTPGSILLQVLDDSDKPKTKRRRKS